MNTFKFFEKITEVIGWLQIVISPTVIGSGIGAIIYFPNPSFTKLIIAIFISLLGLVCGIVLANKMWKGKGTIWFLSRISATPELDNENVDEPKKERANR